MAIYRDPLATALPELALRQERVGSSLASIGPAHRAVLGSDERTVLETALTALAALPTTQEELEAVNRELDKIERAIDGANAALSLDATVSVAPSTTQQPTNDDLGRWLSHIVEPFHGFATQVADRRIARARVAGVDVELEAIVTMTERFAARDGRFILTSRAPPAFAPVSISPQGRLRSLAKRISLASEHETGDPAIDDAYWIRGDEDAVRAVLTPDVVRLLGMISEYEPTLEISQGTVRLTWLAQSLETLAAAVYERAGRSATDLTVPPAMFVLHHAIRRALLPATVAPPQRPSEPSPPRVPTDPARVDELRELFRASGRAWREYQQSDWGVPNPADDFEPQIQALGIADLPVLDELAASADAEVAPWARGRAKEIRAQVVAKGVEKLGTAALAAQFLADDASDQLRVIVVERLRDATDAVYVAELMTQLVAHDGGTRFARVMADERIYNRTAIQRVVVALLRHSRGDVVGALLALPVPICLDAAIAVAWLVPTSPIADALECRLHSMSVELRREIARRLVSAYPPVATEVLRRFYDDDDAEVRRTTIGNLLHRGEPEDLPSVIRALRDDRDQGVRQWAARALARVGAHSSVRDAALEELRRAYESDPPVRKEVMSSIVSIRRDASPKDDTRDPRTEFERSLAALGAETRGGYSTALEDLVYFGHELMSADAVAGKPLLLAAFRHPRGGELEPHLAFRL